VRLEYRAPAAYLGIHGRSHDHAFARCRSPRFGDRGQAGQAGLDDAPAADDTVVETDGVMLAVDPVSLDLVAGCTLDYVESLGGSAFRVNNPLAAAGCGCGSSFSI